MAGHSPGWALVDELLTFDWDGKTIYRTGVVDAQTAQAYATGEIDPKKLRSTHGLAAQGPGTMVQWTESYREAVGSTFLEDVFAALLKFGPPDLVRVVFSFDS